MTDAQVKALLNILHSLDEFDDYGHKRENEVKTWEIEETNYGPIWLSVDTGLKNDEGTMAAIFCRKHRFICIGKRGGMWSSSNKFSKNHKYVKYHGLFDVMNSGYTE